MTKVKLSGEKMTNDDLEQALLNFVHTYTKPCITTGGTIVAGSVNLSDYTCSVLVNDTTFYKVPLKVLKNYQASLIEVPNDALGSESKCQLCFLENNLQLPQLVNVQDCKQILIKIGTSEIVIENGLIEFNGGNNDGLVKVIELTTKLNNLENDVNNLKSAFAGWTVVPGDGGGALKVIASTWYLSTLTPTVQTEIEDTKVTH